MKVEVAILYSGVTCGRLHHGVKKMELPQIFARVRAGGSCLGSLHVILQEQYDKYCDSGKVDASCECYMHCHALIKGYRR